MQMTIGDIARLIDGVVVGDETMLITQPAGIDNAQSGSISFLSNLTYLPHLYTTSASAVIVNKTLVPTEKVSTTLIQVDDVNAAIGKLLTAYKSTKSTATGIHSTVVMGKNTMVHDGVSMGIHTIIGDNVQIGADTVIGAQVYIDDNVHIGAQCKILPGVKIFNNSIIGDRVVIHANAVIGDDGFGFVPNDDGEYQKVEHVGNVIIEDDVEIGNNTTIAKGTMGATIIRKGVKLDNLIHVAHNAEIGAHTVIAAQTGISGSTKIGKYCMIGGQVGVVGHIHIADKTKVQAQSGIAASVLKEDTKIYGSPAIPYFDYLRSFSIFKKLPQFYNEFERIKKQVGK